MGAQVLLIGETKQSHEAEGQSSSTDRSQPALIDSCRGQAPVQALGQAWGRAAQKSVTAPVLSELTASCQGSLLTRVYTGSRELVNEVSALGLSSSSLQCPV